jgi:hypothetical protein
VVRPLVPQLSAGHQPELVEDDRQQAIERLSITFAPREQQRRDLRRRPGGRMSCHVLEFRSFYASAMRIPGQFSRLYGLRSFQAPD